MKNLFKFSGIIAFVAIIGFSMVACGGNDNGGSDITITITGLPSFWAEATGTVTLRVQQGHNDIAQGPFIITGTTGVFSGNFTPGNYELNLRLDGTGYGDSQTVAIAAGANTFTYAELDNFEH